jgi:hypothetical protein
MRNAIQITQELLERLNKDPKYLEMKNTFTTIKNVKTIFQDVISAQIAHIIFLIQIFGNKRERENFYNISNRFLDKKNSAETIFGIILIPQCLTVETKNKIFDFIIIKIVGSISVHVNFDINVQSGKYFSMFQNKLLENNDIRYICENAPNEYEKSLLELPDIILQKIKNYGTDDEKNILLMFIREKHGIYDFLYHCRSISIEKVVHYFALKIIKPLFHKLYLRPVEEESLFVVENVFENTNKIVSIKRKKCLIFIFYQIDGEYTSYFSIYI